MWFKKLSDHSVLINPVAEIRPLLKKHYEDLGRPISTAVYSMLHYRYVMTLKQIKPEAKLPVKPTSLRLLESDANGPIAFHEVSLNSNKPGLLETFISPKYIMNFQNAILKIKEIDKDETKGEIRLLSVPALNVEAVWLNYEGTQPEKFALIWEFGSNDKQLFTKDQFLILLNQMKYRLGKVKGEMGA